MTATDPEPAEKKSKWWILWGLLGLGVLGGVCLLMLLGDVEPWSDCKTVVTTTQHLGVDPKTPTTLAVDERVTTTTCSSPSLTGVPLLAALFGGFLLVPAAMRLVGDGGEFNLANIFSIKAKQAPERAARAVAADEAQWNLTFTPVGASAQPSVSEAIEAPAEGKKGLLRSIRDLF